MTSEVHFIDLRATVKENFPAKRQRLMDAAGIARVVAERDLSAVKLHFGEAGNTAFIRPVFIRQVVAAVRRCGGRPFLTDANTLYAGTRSDAPIVRNIGVLAGTDPVAIDQASVDMVNAEPALAGSCLGEQPSPGLDKFRAIYPKVDWEIQLDYGEAIGLGSRRYEMVRI